MKRGDTVHVSRVGYDGAVAISCAFESKRSLGRIDGSDERSVGGQIAVLSAEGEWPIL